MADLLRDFAEGSQDQAQELGFLDGACMSAPQDAALAQALKRHPDVLVAPSTDGTRPLRVWYMTNTFGFVAGGNGVSQAKCATLVSQFQSGNTADVCVIILWSQGFPRPWAISSGSSATLPVRTASAGRCVWEGREFVHHTSPRQYSGQCTGEKIYDEALSAMKGYNGHVASPALWAPSGSSLTGWPTNAGPTYPTVPARRRPPRS